MLNQISLNNLSIYLDKLIKGRLWLKVIIGLFLGSLLGILLNPTSNIVTQDTSEGIAVWLDLPGQIFMRLVQMIMIPLIFASIISGIVSNNTDKLKQFGVKLLAYFIFTTVVAINIGLLVTILMEPGVYIGKMGGLPAAEVMKATEKTEFSLRTIPSAISNLIPSNPLQAFLSAEMLAVVIFTLIIGIAITQLSEKTVQPLIKFIEAIQKICMIVVSWAMKLVPYAVFGLMAALLSRIGLEALLGLGYFMLTIIVGLIVLLIFYMVLITLLGRTNPFKFLSLIREPQILAFSTASSAAVMPLSMKTADEKLGVSSSVSDFIIPIGATINMDGTALFQCATTIFLAQAYGIELSLISIVLITITVVAASIGTPSVPGGGVIVLASVLQSAGIPADGLIIIIGIDRILGMFRTAVNVTGDLTATYIFNRIANKT